MVCHIVILHISIPTFVMMNPFLFVVTLFWLLQGHDMLVLGEVINHVMSIQLPSAETKKVKLSNAMSDAAHIVRRIQMNQGITLDEVEKVHDDLVNALRNDNPNHDTLHEVSWHMEKILGDTIRSMRHHIRRVNPGQT